MPTRVLLMGDTHIPDEADEVPEKFLQAAKDSDKVVFTGDLTAEGTLDILESFADVRAVKGEDDFLELPEQDLFDVEDLTFGVIHGHQIKEMDFSGEEEKDRIEKLVEFADIMRVDVLVTGHTHKPFMTEREGTVLLNPGSATGVSEEGEGTRTCIQLTVEEKDITQSEVLKD